MIRPDYYDNFKCIAGDCPFTCCQEWKIAVDRDTQAKWKKNNLYGDTVVKGNIRLDADRQCPYLCKDGLCSVVKQYGEDMLSNTCHTYPRETHEHDEFIEQTISMGCPAAVDLLFSKQRFAIEGECDNGLVKLRNRFIDVIQDKNYSIENAFKTIFYLALELERTASEPIIEDGIVNQVADAIDGLAREPMDTYIEQNELFLDLCANYLKERSYYDFVSPLCEAAEALENSPIQLEKVQKDFGLIWESYSDKIRLFVSEEIYSTCLTSEVSLSTIIIKLEWVAITYTAVRQAAFLAYYNDKKLTIEDLKLIIVKIVRMTGYSDDDIIEYLEDSFENIIWEWSYMNLVI